jgi:acyl-CoA synthetase (AMP-forming)/AMP-acid ligase II
MGSEQEGVMERRLGIRAHAEHDPQRPAIMDDNGTLTYGELHLRVNRLSNALWRLGIRPDEKVSVLLHNSARPLEVSSALGKIGAVPVAINYRFKSEEILYIVNHSDSKAMVVGEEFLQVVEPALNEMDHLEFLIIVGEGKEVPALPLPCYPYEEIIVASSEDEPPGGPPDGVSSSLIYTSGTTGRPKGCYKTSRRRLKTLIFYADLFGLVSEDVHLTVCPFYHSAPNAFSLMALLLGNILVIKGHFDPVETLMAMQKYRVTTTFMVPTQINRIVNLPEGLRERLRPSHLRVLIVAAAPFPFPLKKEAVAYFGTDVLYEFYGATEQSVNTILYPHEQLLKPGSCGRAVEGNDIKLLDEQGRPVAVGEVGEFFVKNEYLMDCYYKMPVETAGAIRDGYCSVGDLARMDEEGYYYIIDRKVDMVISGGVNIYPVEIEECLYRHPKVYDAAVIGVPDEQWGERLVAFIVPKEGLRPTSQEILEYLSEHLADYKRPREVYFVRELPYSPQGKVLKRQLRDSYSRGLHGDA